MPGPHAISPAQLARRIGLAAAPALIDVRLPADAEADPHLLSTARSSAHTDVETLIPALQGRRAVVICARGRKLSEGAAALLRAGGTRPKCLKAGMRHGAQRACRWCRPR